jgi:predicted transcriptional regulator
VAEATLVRLVRQQAEMLLEAEQMLKNKDKQKSESKSMGEKELRAELRRLEEAKIADYEKYKEGKITRERFVEKKTALDARKKELASALAECEAQDLMDDTNQRQYAEAFQIKEYLHLEVFDKEVMASLISSAKVLGEDCLEVTWKHQDIFQKIFTNV